MAEGPHPAEGARARRRGGGAGPIDPLSLGLLAVLAAYVVWPIVLVLGESFRAPGEGWTLQPWRQFLERGHPVYVGRSLGLSLATVLGAGAFGTALAWLYARVDFPGRRLLAGLTLLPFTLPPLVGVFAIWTLMGEGGLFHRATRLLPGDGFWIESGYTGVLLVHVYSMYVFFFVLVGGALAALDESQLEAARDLGATPRRAFLRVALPQLLPALAGAAMLTFMTSMASFTAPFFYMAGRPVLTVGIQQALESFEPGLASADGVVLVACAALFLYLILRYERSIEGGTRGAARRRPVGPARRGRWLITAGAGALTLLLLVPHLSLARDSFVKPGTGFVGVPEAYTLENYASLWRRGDAFRPIANSLRASALATVGVLIFALGSSWTTVRRRALGRGALGSVIMLPWAVPGTVVGLGLLWISRAPNPLTWGAELRGTIALLALAYFIRLLPLAHRTITAGLRRVSRDLEGAARDLGASPAQAFGRVTLPLIAPAVVAAATLTFATAMGEFVSSILLYGPGTEPVSVKIDQLRRGPAGLQLAAAYSALLMLMITATFVVFGRRAQEAV